MPDSIDYRSPDAEPARAKRTLGKWILLFIIWTVGLLVWSIYFAAAAYVLFRIL